jgi:RNA polymerase sigma-70 factor, ECF subfamily
LRALLLRGVQFELDRRHHFLAHMYEEELDRVATEAADDVLARIIDELDSFSGRSQFSTWAYKYVLLEAAVRTRHGAWRPGDTAHRTAR